MRNPEVTLAYRPEQSVERGQTNNLFPQTSFTLIGSLSGLKTKRLDWQKLSRLKKTITVKHKSHVSRKVNSKQKGPEM